MPSIATSKESFGGLGTGARSLKNAAPSDTPRGKMKSDWLEVLVT